MTEVGQSRGSCCAAQTQRGSPGEGDSKQVGMGPFSASRSMLQGGLLYEAAAGPVEEERQGLKQTKVENNNLTP